MFRRLAAKAGCCVVSRSVSHELLPIQLSVSVKGGVEASDHAVSKFIAKKIDPDDPSTHSPLHVKSPFWWRSGRCRHCCSDFLLQCAGNIEADHTDSLPNRCRPLRGWKTRPKKERIGRPNRHQSIPAPRERGLIQPFFR